MSHEQSITVGIDGKFYNVKTVVKGKKLKKKQAVDHAIKTKTLGRAYKNLKNAVGAAKKRSKSFDK